TSCDVLVVQVGLLLRVRLAVPESNKTSDVFFFTSRRRHTRFSRDWSSDVCSSDLSRHRSPDRAIVPPCSSRFAIAASIPPSAVRSEERRVGKECSTRWSRVHQQEKEED